MLWSHRDAACSGTPTSGRTAVSGGDWSRFVFASALVAVSAADPDSCARPSAPSTPSSPRCPVRSTAFGIPPEIAIATVVTHRLFTTYLPPIWGNCATKKLIGDGDL